MHYDLKRLLSNLRCSFLCEFFLFLSSTVSSGPFSSSSSSSSSSSLPGLWAPGAEEPEAEDRGVYIFTLIPHESVVAAFKIRQEPQTNKSTNKYKSCFVCQVDSLSEEQRLLTEALSAHESQCPMMHCFFSSSGLQSDNMAACSVWGQGSRIWPLTSATSLQL